MPGISAVIITINEEKFIEACLKSIQWVDEIIVVDSYSNDKTVDLCRKYTDKVFQREWAGFANQKNFGIEKAQNKWILSIDADEQVTPELKSEIIEVLDTGGAFDGYFIPRKNHLNGRWMRFAGQYPDYQLRLFKNSARFILREVHERVSVKGPVGYLNSSLIHFTYNDIRQFVDKINQYTDLDARERIKSLGKVRVLEFFYLPLRKFFWAYFYKQGFRDGILGLIISVSLAYYVFLELAKAWQFSYTKKG